MLLKTRRNQELLRETHARPRGRLLAITGARQVGKSTLARVVCPDYPIVNLDAPSEREVYSRLTPADWIARYPRAIIDEAQKLPAVFDTIKACFDRDASVRYLLLGSSQILMMTGIQETLAGRIALCELFPLDLGELSCSTGTAELPPTRLLQLLRAEEPTSVAPTLFTPETSLGDSVARNRLACSNLLRWGGMPVLTHDGWTDDDRYAWLEDYQATYLQRDLGDLVRLDRLEPFVRAQKAAALRTAQTINFSDLARTAGVSPPTARQFLRYLEISYQVILLPGWFRNPDKRLVKQPKLHFLDVGVRRAILRKRGHVDGAEFESAVVAEVTKQVRTTRAPVELHHLRTQDGREVDLLIEREDGYIAVECKLTTRASGADAKHLRGLEALLDKPLLLGLVVSQDPAYAPLTPDGRIWKVEASALLGG